MDSVQCIKKNKKEKPWGVEIIKSGQSRCQLVMQFHLRNVISPTFDSSISRLETVVADKLLEGFETMIFDVKHWHTSKLTKAIVIIAGISNNNSGSSNTHQ